MNWLEKVCIQSMQPLQPSPGDIDIPMTLTNIAQPTTSNGVDMETFVGQLASNDALRVQTCNIIRAMLEGAYARNQNLMHLQMRLSCGTDEVAMQQQGAPMPAGTTVGPGTVESEGDGV